ncbi:PQQ-binding-like beta-propeller repeat protein [Candidatus Hydrogenedentota bacterium]
MKKLSWIECLTVLFLFAASNMYFSHADADTDPLSKDILDRAGISNGLCAIIGPEDGDLPLNIARNTNFIVHVLATNARMTEAVCSAVDSKGLYGARIIVEQSYGETLPYADNMIDLLICPSLDKEKLSLISAREISRILTPGGKGLIICKNAAERPEEPDLRRWFDGVDSDNIKTEQCDPGLIIEITKPLPIGIDSWSHWNHGPDNNPMSTDTVIKAPYRTQWVGGPLYSPMPAVTTAAGGRIFLAMGHIAHHEREEEWLNTLVARNGYNGALLWSRKLPEGYMVHRSAFVATENAFYMLDGNRCLVLNPVTGIEIGSISVPDLDGELKWIAKSGNRIFLLSGKQPDNAEKVMLKGKGRGWGWGSLSRGYYETRVPWGFGRILAAYDLAEKKIVWIHTEQSPIDSRSLALGDDRIFFLSPDSRIACLDARLGKGIWKNDDEDVLDLIAKTPNKELGEKLASTPGFRSTCYSLYTPKALIFQAQQRLNVVSISTDNGRLLWHMKKTTSNPNMLYTDRAVVVGVGDKLGNILCLDPVTGEVLDDLKFNKYACTRLTGCPDSFFVRGEGLRRYDRRERTTYFDAAFRPGCNDGAIPANGLLYVGPWLCDCNLQLIGTVALVSANGFDPASVESEERQLKTLSTYKLETPTPDERDWATYRKDRNRSACSTVRVGEMLKRAWQFRTKSPVALCAPTSASGMIFLAGDDGKIRAVDAETGKLRWQFLTGGPTVMAPTIWEGRAYVGSGDGYVYALEATTGRLLWKFRAAPIERKIMVYGKLCSNWPVNTGVVVEDGKAYFAAGFIDYDGTYVYAIDAETGDLVWRNSASGHLNAETRKGVSAQGSMAIANGRLLLAGGNMVSPAIYDLESGECLNAAPKNHFGRTNRGQEILVFEEYILNGGKSRASSSKPFMETARFNLGRVDWDPLKWDLVTFIKHRTPPVWNDDIFVFVSGWNSAPMSFERSATSEFFASQTSPEAIAARAKLKYSYRATKPVDAKALPKKLWTAKQLEGCRIMVMALAENMVVVAGFKGKDVTVKSEYFIALINSENGELSWETDLPIPPVPGGLLIDREGRVVVALEGGSLFAYHGK